MRGLAFILRSIQLVLLSLSVSLFPPNTGWAQAEDDSTARQLAESAFSEETLIAISIASIDEMRQQMRDKIGAIVDISSVSDRDIDVFTRVSIEINARGLAAGLRRALEKKLAELPERELEIMLACRKMPPCKREELSKETIAFIGELPAFGKVKGEEIGRAVGEATAAKLLEKLKSMDESEFDNRDELIRILSLPTFKL